MLDTIEVISNIEVPDTRRGLYKNEVGFAMDELLLSEQPIPDNWVQEWKSLRGRHPFFLFDDITPETVEIISAFSKIVPQIGMIDVILHSPGGILEQTFKAPYIFKTFCPQYEAVVPKYAKSGATLFALGASKIIMGRWAELGPLDPQIQGLNEERRYFSSPESALEGFHALRFAQQEVKEYMDTFVAFLRNRGISPRHAVKEAKDLVEATVGRIYTNVSPFELGNSGRILEVMERYCLKIMDDSYTDREAIAKKLVWGYPDHSFFIDANEAKNLGLFVETADDKLQDLLDELLASLRGGRCIGTSFEDADDADEEPEIEESEEADET